MATFAPVAGQALHDLPSVPESEISEALAERLPEPAPAPWTTSGTGIQWFHRACPGAAGRHQRGLTYARSIPITMGAFLRYEQGPVGAYDEILASPTFVQRNRRVSLGVPFIAVDSEASVAGGRGNWALPKTLADFDWSLKDGAPHLLSADGEGWSVRARVRWTGPRLLLYARASEAQVRADGTVITIPIRSRGLGRLARVEIASEGPTLADWLRAGVHLGVVIERATHTILPGFADPLR
jgi:hypothetical protein